MSLIKPIMNPDGDGVIVAFTDSDKMIFDKYGNPVKKGFMSLGGGKVWDRDKDLIFDTARHVKFHDMEPLLIEDKPNALDDLGLTDVRRKMDAAHNEMIWQKYKLKLIQEIPADLDLEPDTRSPYERAIDPRPERKIERGNMQEAIDSISFEDPEYRRQAEEYFETVIPKVKEETQRLQAELNSAYAEWQRVTKEYEQKVQDARNALLRFNDSVMEEVRKFETADNGSKTAEGHVVISNGRRSILSHARFESSPIRTKKYEYLEDLNRFAERFDQNVRVTQDFNRNHIDMINTAGSPSEVKEIFGNIFDT